MTNEGKLVLYCIQIYADEKQLRIGDVVALFYKNSVMDYISERYAALHTMGETLIVKYIEEYIDSKQKIE